MVQSDFNKRVPAVFCALHVSVSKFIPVLNCFTLHLKWHLNEVSPTFWNFKLLLNNPVFIKQYTTGLAYPSLRVLLHRGRPVFLAGGPWNTGLGIDHETFSGFANIWLDVFFNLWKIALLQSFITEVSKDNLLSY